MWKKTLVVAVLAAWADGAVAQDAPAEEARPMSEAERGQLRMAVRQYAQGLLDTYVCLQMQVGAYAANTACDGQPCNLMQLMQLFPTPIDDVPEPFRQAVCAGTAVVATGGTFGGDILCTVDTPWFERYGSEPVCPWDFASGGCSGGIAMDPIATIALIEDLVEHQVADDQRDAFIQAIVEAWPTAGSPDVFEAAASNWEVVAASCTSAGACALGDWSAGATTAGGWTVVRMAILRAWLDAFSVSDPARPVFRHGCRDGYMYVGDSSAPAGFEWRFEHAAACPAGSSWMTCFSNWEPQNTYEAAEAFARTLVP